MTPRALSIAVTVLLVAGGDKVFPQTHPRHLQSAECPFVGENWAAGLKAACHWLVVPQDRTRDSIPGVRLFVVVLRADTPSGKPPLVMLHGGPGESALLPMLRGALAQRGPRVRDLVIYDQRGAGLSEPDPCPEYASRRDGLQISDLAASTDRRAMQTVARECVASMRARGISPAAHSTAANVGDLIDLRLELGYARWDIYGASYGARLALEAMRRDATGIRAVILENPLPPRAEAESALATQHALERVFAACARNAACHAAFPAPEQTFFAVFDTLSRAPLSIPAAGTGSRRIVLGGDAFALAIRRLLRSREGIASLPLILRELHNGDRLRAAGELARFDEAAGFALRAEFWLVSCYDQYGPDYIARLDTVRAEAWIPLRGLRDNLQECPIWQTQFADSNERAAVISDIPTLIVTGEFDARTPVEFGRRIASTLSRSYLFELPGETHGGRPGACRGAIIAQFLDDPQRAPDATCIARMQPFEFLTQWSP